MEAVMTIHVDTWTDGYLALRARAYEARGSIELDSGARWPRTTGEDVIVIAALFDRALRVHGTPGILRGWHATLTDLEREALAAPHATYRENKAFWSNLETAAVFLDDLAVAPPVSALWDAAIEHLGTQVVRNAGPSGDGPFGHFDDVKTFDDLYLAEYKHLREKRGADNLAAPAGVAGAQKPIPRATNADVIELATYWSKQLANAKHVMGHDSMEARWKTIAADVEKLAKSAKPEDVYAKNNEFWRALGDLAIYVAAADEAPTAWDLVKGSLNDSLHHLPENLAHVAEKGVELVADAAHAVGKVANEAGKGLFAGFGTPLLIGGGLLGLFLISRNRRHQQEV
jgi:hypothetical protein